MVVLKALQETVKRPRPHSPAESEDSGDDLVQAKLDLEEQLARINAKIASGTKKSKREQPEDKNAGKEGGEASATDKRPRPRPSDAPTPASSEAPRSEFPTPGPLKPPRLQAARPRPVAAPLRATLQNKQVATTGLRKTPSQASLPTTLSERTFANEDSDDLDDDDNDDSVIDSKAPRKKDVTHSGRFGIVYDPRTGKASRLINYQCSVSRTRRNN